MKSIDANKLVVGDRASLSRAITLVESKKDSHRAEAQELIKKILPHTGKSKRIGISGIPGVGKSTFIEALGLHLCEQGLKIAVLAVDPSSPVSGGSILGDKTRMENLSRHENAFIRPTPTSGSLGGVAEKTRETMLLCEAAGFDVVLIETVGVGQSEYQVASMVDFFMLLLVPGAGDELQGIKKGIIELSDLLVVNKSDGDALPLAKVTKEQYESALHILKPSNFWTPRVVNCSSTEQKGIEDVWGQVESYFDQAKKNNFLSIKRAQQNQQWFEQLFFDVLHIHLKNKKGFKDLWDEQLNEIQRGQTTPQLASLKIINKISFD